MMCQIDQHAGSRTQSKMHNLSKATVHVFLLQDAILFQGHGKSQAQDFRLRVVECKFYHNFFLNT
jgi:hypothetical protein